MTQSTRFQQLVIRALRSLEGEVETPDAASFRANLKTFSAGFESADVRQLTSFHALTTVYEFFAVYLMFRVCRKGIIMPRSWIDAHLPWFVSNWQSRSPEASPDGTRHIYRQCLVNLTRDFARIVSGLNPSALSDISKGFRLGKRFYPSRLLHWRNVELLSLAVVNLRAVGDDLPGITEVWKEVSKVTESGLLGSSFETDVRLDIRDSFPWCRSSSTQNHPRARGKTGQVL